MCFYTSEKESCASPVSKKSVTFSPLIIDDIYLNKEMSTSCFEKDKITMINMNLLSENAVLTNLLSPKSAALPKNTPRDKRSKTFNIIKPSLKAICEQPEFAKEVEVYEENVERPRFGDSHFGFYSSQKRNRNVP